MKAFWAGVIAVTLVLAAFLVGRYTAPEPCPEISVETVVIRDTIHDTVPVEVEKLITRVIRDTALIVVTDTLTNTVYVNVPIEETRYKTDDYDLTIEGYRARLLSIDVYKQTERIETIREKKVKNRWGIGLQVGYGYGFIANEFCPYIGVGLSYNIITF